MKTIMVVDDEEDIRDAMNKILTKEGYKVILASSGRIAIEKIKESKVDLVLLDVLMPGMKIAELLEKMKGHRIMIVSTVRKAEAETKDIFKGDVIGYIEKPFEMEEFISKIHEATHSKKPSADLFESMYKGF